MAKLLRAPGGKLLRGPGGKLLTTASLQAMRDCCCGGCDVESCCVAYADCPDTITITVCPWDHEGGGCVSFVISHQGGGIYRSAGDIDYPAVGGKTGKVLRFETQDWGGQLVDQFAIRDSDGMTTWITYSSSCGDGRRLIYNGWQGSGTSRARWDSGMTCCPCGGCPCSPVRISGFFGNLSLEEYDPENDCCEYTHFYEGQYGTAADIHYNAAEGRYELAITLNAADRYIAWDGYVCNAGGTITAVCEYVAGAFAPDWDWQTLACGDYPVTITAAAGCDCWKECAGNA